MTKSDYSTWDMEVVHYMRSVAIEYREVLRMCGSDYMPASVYVSDVNALQRIAEITGAEIKRERKSDHKGDMWAHMSIDLDGVEFRSCARVDG